MRSVERVRAVPDLGQRFFVGGVEVLGARLCQPCKYLVRKSGVDVLPAVIGKGGLRVKILSEGVISVGDVVAPG